MEPIHLHIQILQYKKKQVWKLFLKKKGASIHIQAYRIWILVFSLKMLDLGLTITVYIIMYFKSLQSLNYIVVWYV